MPCVGLPYGDFWGYLVSYVVERVVEKSIAFGVRIVIMQRCSTTKEAKCTKAPTIYVAGNMFVLVCPLIYAADK